MKIYTTLDPTIQDELNTAGNTNTYNKWKMMMNNFLW